MGIPSVTVVTEPFIDAAKAVARSQGIELPLVVIPHDYLTEDEESIRARIAPVIDDMIAALFGTDA
jgi:hypothetical protein